MVHRLDWPPACLWPIFPVATLEHDGELRRTAGRAVERVLAAVLAEDLLEQRQADTLATVR
jgi:hypothetical protein